MTCLVAGAGAGVQDVAKEVAAVNGVTKVLVADNAGFNGFLPEKLTPLLVASQVTFSLDPCCVGLVLILISHGFNIRLNLTKMNEQCFVGQIQVQPYCCRSLRLLSRASPQGGRQARREPHQRHHRNQGQCHHHCCHQNHHCHITG